MRILYKNFKNDELYFYADNNSYNQEDKTIEVRERKVVEFDYKLFDDFKPIHYRYVMFVSMYSNVLQIAFPNMKVDSKEELYSKDKFIESYEEYIDEYVQASGLSDEEKMKAIASARKTQRKLKIEDIKKGIEEGTVTNYVEYELESNVSVSKGDLDNEQAAEPKKEEAKKVIRMKYSDYKKTDFDSVKDSYDKDTKAIDVYVPIDYEYSLERKVITMDYEDYKKHNFKAVEKSYNERKNTVEVYVPLDFEYELPKRKIIDMYYDDAQKCKFRKIPHSYNSRKHTYEVSVPEDFEYTMPKFHIETVLYKDYKNKYEGKYRIANSYNDKKGTIDLWFPEGVEYVRDEKDEHYEEIHAFKEGYTNQVTIEPKVLNPDDFEVEVEECLKNLN